MENYLKTLLLLFLTSFLSCKTATTEIIKKEEAITTEKKEDTFVKDNYTKQEVQIEMRDGTKLHTTIYSPKDTSTTYPILLQRTPYSCKPYGEDEFRTKIGPESYFNERRKHYRVSRC